MAEIKTQQNDGDVMGFLQGIENEQKRKDSLTLLRMMQRITVKEPKMWGSSIVGFGSYHYKYESGQEGDWFLTGFSPRKQSMTVYIISGFAKFDALMSQLGKHRTGKSCLYFNKLEQIDTEILRQLITESVAYMESKYA